MKHEIIITVDKSCKTCSYVELKPVPMHNLLQHISPFSGQWRCRLFDENLYSTSGQPATLKEDNPEQCGDCRLLIERHLATPEFQG